MSSRRVFMAIIKVSASVFSKYKTVDRALKKASKDDVILLANGKYKESISIHRNVTITAKYGDIVYLKGAIIIPKGFEVTFENINIHPSTQFYVEGTVFINNCTFDGSNTNVLLSFNGGKATISNCHFFGANEIAVILCNKSVATFLDCTFDNNQKSHLFIENSKVELKNCEFSKARHGIWLKSNSKVTTENVNIHHHSGTQIIVQEESTYQDSGSTIEHGEGNGIYANDQSTVLLNETIVQHHVLPQLWIQKSTIQLTNCSIEQGSESGLMLREQSEGTIINSKFSHHKIANIQLTLESLLNMTDSNISKCRGVGIQVKEKSIVNFINAIFEDNVLSQLYITEKSICTGKDSIIKNGKQVGIFVDKEASCSIVASKISNHANTAITAIGAEIFLLDTEIFANKGNGILTVKQTEATIENCQFQKNQMPHIAGKEKAQVTVSASTFTGGKGIFMIENCQLEVNDCHFTDGTGVQIEVGSHTKATIHKTKIIQGTSNAIKAMKDASIHITECQIIAHKMPQIVVNDSSLIFRNSELLHGEKNGFIIENHSEALIQDSFISNHQYPQVWIDLESSVELSSTQLTEGHESDIYVQNNSTVHATNCIIHNDKFNFNIQAVNHSKINLVQTAVENSVGEKFYSENHSEITNSYDEVN